MQLKEFNIIVDIKQTQNQTYFEVVQGDYNTNVLNIEIVDGLNKYDLTGLNVEIAFAKPDKTTVMQDATSGITILDAVNGKIECVLNTNTIAAPGTVIAEVRILEASTNRLLTSATFRFYVRKAIVNEDTIKSTNEFPILAQLVDDVSGVIATEAARVAAENERITAENARVAAENTRQSNEATRQSNESSRVSAENTRVTAEQARQSNETTRQQNEAARQASIADIENRFTQLTIAQQQEAEVINARTSTIKNKTFPALTDRIEETETDIIMVKADISDIKGFIGYTDNDIVGVEVDFANRTFTRLAGAVNKNPGADFDSIKAFGGRKRCIVTDDGKVLAYYGEPGYSETGKTTVEIKKDSVTYPVGTIVQVMVEQPKFYYKVVPLKLEKIPDYVEVNTLTVTAGATADGNLTITLDGVAFTVSVFATDNTPELVAAKIRNAIYTGWTTGGTGAKVTFTCNTPGTKTTATFNGGSTGVTATVEKTVAGSISIGYHMRKARYYVSDTYKPGFKVHPAFIRNGVVKDKIYLSAYEGSIYDVSAATYLLADEQVADFTVSTGDKLSSIAYAKPASGLIQNLTRANTRKLANNRGVGWQLSDVLSASVTQMLFIIEYASFNIQDKIGLGIVNKTDDSSTNMSELTGATTNLGNASGMAAGTNGLTSVSYRGEENPWGNIWKWMDGLNIEAKGIHQAYWADSGFADDIKTSPYKNCGFTLAKANGYVSAFGYSEDCDFLFLPSEVIGASNLPVGDYFYQNHNYAGFLVPRLGGSWHSGSAAGAFSWYVDAASSSRGRAIGGRLLYVPQ